MLLYCYPLFLGSLVFSSLLRCMPRRSIWLRSSRRYRSSRPRTLLLTSLRMHLAIRWRAIPLPRDPRRMTPARLLAPSLFLPIRLPLRLLTRFPTRLLMRRLMRTSRPPSLRTLGAMSTVPSAPIFLTNMAQMQISKAVQCTACLRAQRRRESM